MVTKEERYVVLPLMKWFKGQKAAWRLEKPRFGTSATGWDIEAHRHNLDLLVEAKYMDNSSFLASFTGLVTAPLAKRPQRFMFRKYRGWSHGICWAMGTNNTHWGMYQIMFDYFARNLPFWRHYAKDVKMKYIFFIQKGRVAKIPFGKILQLAAQYQKVAYGRNQKGRKVVAETLLRRALKFG